jgi:hypothetical protein
MATNRTGDVVLSAQTGQGAFVAACRAGIGSGIVGNSRRNAGFSSVIAEAR